MRAARRSQTAGQRSVHPERYCCWYFVSTPRPYSAGNPMQRCSTVEDAARQKERRNIRKRWREIRRRWPRYAPPHLVNRRSGVLSTTARSLWRPRASDAFWAAAVRRGGLCCSARPATRAAGGWQQELPLGALPFAQALCLGSSALWHTRHRREARVACQHSSVAGASPDCFWPQEFCSRSRPLEGFIFSTHAANLHLKTGLKLT